MVWDIGDVDRDATHTWSGCIIDGDFFFKENGKLKNIKGEKEDGDMIVCLTDI